MKKELPKELEELFNAFKKIFSNDNKRLTIKQREELKSLGFEVYGDNHPKIRIGKTVITLHSTASDYNINRVTLRRIRKILIDEYEKGEIRC